LGNEEGGVGVKLADQGQASAVAVAEAGHLVRAEAGIPDEDERPTGEANQQEPQQPAHQLRRGAVRPPALPVVLLGAVEVHEHGQGPGARGEGEADQDTQDDPLVAVAPGGVALGGADGVAVTGLAVDLPAGVAIDGIVADEEHRAGGEQVFEQEGGQGAAELGAGPRGAGEDALVVGAMAWGERAEGA
jgi:hypothetical protein